MIINGKEISVNDLIKEINIDNNIPLKRKNSLVLRNSQIETLKKYNIEYENFTSLSSLIYEIEEILTTSPDLEDLNDLSQELQEQNYYQNTNK